MAAPNTPGAARRTGLRRARWVATGTAVGAAVLATGTIAVVHAAPSDASAGTKVSTSRDTQVDEDEFGDAQPYTPSQPQVTPQGQSVPQFQPQTSSRGS